ncbi:BTB/POZ and MATH domain-containing protein 3-like [Aegilops tauschii subsp. strangulata]|uniref:BTB/POZ and MATH domain-containing protein 3-like n=1 Tax=Aegilops tauschii subsp. strangulata TaxID=200361 RepID=UPI003CC85511
MGNIIASSAHQYAPETETWSRCYTEGTTVTHNFEIAGYSLLHGMGTGNYVTSSTFTVGGCDNCEWDIMFYPDGATKDEGEEADHASAYLRLRPCSRQPCPTAVMTKYTLSLWGKDGQLCQQRSTRHTFTPGGTGWGHVRFVPKSKLLALKDDCFTITCVLTCLKERHMEEAHRALLAARTPFFRAELFGPMKENKMQRINIDDVEPSVFKALLHFIYTDALPDNHDVRKNTTLQHLMVAADRYGLDRLAAMCEGELCRGIDVQTVATTLTLAKQHCRERLKDICIDFMSSRDVFGDVKKTDGFKHLVTSCPEVITDILQENLPLPEVGVVRTNPRRTPGWLKRQQRSSQVRRAVLVSACVLVPAVVVSCRVYMRRH